MGRANNTARSLQIISRQQGWDPQKIEGFPNGPGHPELPDYDFDEIGYRARESPLERSTTQDSFPGTRLDLQAEFPKIPSGIPPEGEEIPKDRGPNGDPYPAKPGSRPTRRPR